MKNADFSNLDILARSMSIWDKIRYDKEKMVNNYEFTLYKVFGCFLGYFGSFVCILGLSNPVVNVRTTRLNIKKFYFMRTEFGKDLKKNIFLYCVD